MWATPISNAVRTRFDEPPGAHVAELACIVFVDDEDEQRSSPADLMGVGELQYFLKPKNNNNKRITTIITKDRKLNQNRVNTKQKSKT